MKLIIVSGRSGSGKSIVLNVLEDLGYYCIDNLPLAFLPELNEKLNKAYHHIAVSIDARNVEGEMDHLYEIIDTLKKTYQHSNIIFLDASDDILLNRFSETRRRHPLTNQITGLKEALRVEKKLLQPLLDLADLRIDTSHYTLPQLRDLIRKHINLSEPNLSVTIQSFGYKYGIPTDSDFIFDVRSVPNPYWEQNLRHLTGLDKEVQLFLEEFSQVHEMLKMIKDFIEKWLPSFQSEHRKYLTVSIGCTGGQHRSVYFTEKLSCHLSSKHSNISVRHRDCNQSTP